jgi:hypothetical protein
MTGPSGHQVALILMVAFLATALLTGSIFVRPTDRVRSPALEQPWLPVADSDTALLLSQTRTQLSGAITPVQNPTPSTIIVSDGTVVSEQLISDT